ncbi:MAG: hypothetical protein J6Z45_04150 [Oscillospiraceae bacterium]|nr:hypothetical protein [Oscillospiraceae bacterium]
MADNKQILAQQVYGKLISALTSREWTYARDDDRMRVQFDVSGDDFPMRFVMIVDAERQQIRLLSRLPFEMSESKRMEGAVATCVASFMLPDGNFDYNVETGEIGFRVTHVFMDSDISEEVLQYMISWSCAVVDKYNDKFFAIDKGYLTLDDFIAGDS